MKIEDIWQEMEAEAQSGSTTAWLMRFALAQLGTPLMIALDTLGKRRVILIPLTQDAIPSSRNWPECHGLEIISVMLDAKTYFGIRLRDRRCTDVFTVLADDLAPRISSARNEKHAASLLLDRLRHWQQFLTVSREGLSIEAQRGVWGELHVMQAHLLPLLGIGVSIEGWKGSSAAHQDFQFTTGAIEVKTTSAKQPQSVRITSERQLDDTGVGSLFLHVVVVDEREVDAGANMIGQSLAGIISEIRSQIVDQVNTLSLFNERLLDRGWIDAHANRYEGRRWTVRSEYSFQVRQDFPRIVEKSLRTGVGDVNYAVNLVACTPFAVLTEDMLKSLN